MTKLLFYPEPPFTRNTFYPETPFTRTVNDWHHLPGLLMTGTTYPDCL